jgi:hypothetical protein
MTLLCDDADAILAAVRARIGAAVLENLAPVLERLAKRGPWDDAAQLEWTEAVEAEMAAVERAFYDSLASAAGGKA